MMVIKLKLSCNRTMESSKCWGVMFPRQASMRPAGLRVQFSEDITVSGGENPQLQN